MFSSLILSFTELIAAGNNMRHCSYVHVSTVFRHRYSAFSLISFAPSHHGDTEDVFRSAAVARGLSHPAEFSHHVAQPVDCFISVALDNRQDLIILLFGHIQQLGNLIQLQVQLPNTWALWRREEERSGEILCVKMSAEVNTSCEGGGASPVSRAPWQASHWFCSCQHSEVCLRRSRHNFLFRRKRGKLCLATPNRLALC